MYFKKRVWFFIGLMGIAYLMMGAATSFADLHMKKETKRYFKDYPRKFSSSIETWQSRDKEYRAINGRIVIMRRDLKKKWVIDSKAKTYIESSLEKRKPQKPKTPEEKMHNQGYNYNPTYDWEIQKTDEEKDICGIKCRKFIIDGDADFSEKIVELWVANDIGIDVNLYKNLSAHFQSDETASLKNKFKELKDCFILEEKVVTENPIASQSTSEEKYITVEDVSPPEGIYELPEGLKKKGTLDKRRKK